MHLYSALLCVLLNVFSDSNKDLTWCTQMLHLSQKTMSLPSSLSGERHTSQMTSSSYSIPNPSSVSMAWFMLSWHCLSSASITRSIVSSSTGPSPVCTIQNVLYPLKHIMIPNLIMEAFPLAYPWSQVLHWAAVASIGPYHPGRIYT